MEDSKKVPPQPKDSSSPTDRIIELTPELEVISATRGKIIDLTQVLSSPGGPVPAPPKPIVARTSSSPFSAKVSRQKGIESDVDAAFDLIQSKAEQMRGPRVEPAPSEKDLKVEAPKPIGDWDDTIIAAPLSLEEAETAPEEAPRIEPLLDFEDRPADPEPAPLMADAPKHAPVVEEKISSLEDLKSDDALELTEVVQPIDLMPSNEMEPAPAPAEEHVPATPEVMEILNQEPPSLLETAIEMEAEEEVIELTEIASAEEMAAAGYTPPSIRPFAAEPQMVQAQEEKAADEEIIELVDRVEPPPADDAVAAVAEPIAAMPEPSAEFGTEIPAVAAAEDRDTEAMTREVFAEPQAPPEPAPEPPPRAVKPESDQVIRLDSVLSHVRKHQERISEEITLGIEEELAKEPITAGAKFPIGIAMEDVKEALGPATSYSASEIETVIENVIRNKYGQTIEQMIASVVEKVVTREMESIRRNLMEDQGAPDDL